jgi:DNA-binding transcriptional regulator LsrR (DeoR family)
MSEPSATEASDASQMRASAPTPMPPIRDGRELMTQAARLYFDRQQSKVDIAATLGISRFRVARLISEALETGLVRVEYRDAPPEDRAIAAAMEEEFDLDLCVVAGGVAGQDAVARLTAGIIDELVGPEEIVGIAWGSTLASVVAAMPTRRDPSIAVVALAGSSVRFARDHDPAELGRLLADRWGASFHPLLAPAFVDDAATRDALLRQPDIAETTAMFERVTTAIVGIGALGVSVPDASSLARSGAIDADLLDRLAGAGIVGDLLLHPVTEDGTFAATDLAARAMGISVEGLQAVPRVIAVAAGAVKGAAIRGALRSGLVRILVTDAAGAQAAMARSHGEDDA